jgi:flagellar motor switch protein FliN
MKEDEFFQERQRLKEQILSAREQHAEDTPRQSGQRLSQRDGGTPDLGRLMDIPVRLSLEVGGAELAIRDILALQQGEVVELDREAGEALDVLVNGKLIARGEVVVVDDRLGVRLTEVISPSERLQSMN